MYLKYRFLELQMQQYYPTLNDKAQDNWPAFPQWLQVTHLYHCPHLAMDAPLKL